MHGQSNMASPTREQEPIVEIASILDLRFPNIYSRVTQGLSLLVNSKYEDVEYANDFTSM